MRGFLQCYDGGTYALPSLTEWEVELTGGDPCDSFCVTCLYDEQMPTILRRANRFYAEDEGGETVFRGVVDEYVIEQEAEGKTVTVMGRGMAALLMDNESEAVNYAEADLREIYRNHAAPYGIACKEMGSLTGSDYRVESGSSQWRAMSRFTEYYGGFSPRMTPLGELVLSEKQTGRVLAVDAAGMVALRYREKRYGVLTEVLVKDKSQNKSLTVENSEMKQRGGSARRVIYMPRKSTYAAMRYSGEYQIMKSKEEQLEIEVELAGNFLAEPGDEVRLGNVRGLSGSYCVKEAHSCGGDEGVLCTLVLREM